MGIRIWEGEGREGKGERERGEGGGEGGEGERRAGLVTCVSIRQSKSRLGCVPEFTNLGILRAIFFLSSGCRCLFTSTLS